MTVDTGDKKIIIIAGPNGAGKTTFARAFLPNEAKLPRFINADAIAAGLAPEAVDTVAIRAGRVMLEHIAAYAEGGESFAFETTLSGLNYLRHIRRWRAAGYWVTLYFLQLPNAEIAIARVAARVRQKGHHVPDDVVRRRFAGGLENFHGQYKSVVDDWVLYDNTTDEPVIIDWGENH